MLKPNPSDLLAGYELRAKEISILRAVLLVLLEEEEDLVWYFTFYLDAPANQDDACKSRKLSIYERQSFGKFTNNNLLSLGIQTSYEIGVSSFSFILFFFEWNENY